MDPLSIAAGIAGLLTLTGAIISKGYACINRAKKNGSDIEALLSEVARFSGILVGMKAQFAISAQPVSSLQWLAEDNALMWQNNMNDCEKTLRELVEVVDSLATASVLRLVVKADSLNANLDKLMLKVERFRSFFVLCLQLQANTESRETSRLTSEILKGVQNIAAGQEKLTKQIESRDNSDLRNKIIDWLGITGQVAQDDLSKVRSVNSAEWLFKRDEFSIWLTSEESRNLWLWGIQGSGKSVIISKVIETIRECALEDGEALIYHYCRFSDTTTLKPERIIGGLIAQLLNATDTASYPESLIRALNHYRSSTYPNFTELVKIFYEVSLNYSKIFIIIDGLDEIVERIDILDFFADLSTDHGATYKTFIASRPEFDIEYAFRSHMIIAVTQEDIQADLETYVRQELEKLQIVDVSGIGQYSIITELVERAQGMFLWAVCQINHLSRIRTAITLDVLTNLPRGLESTFEGILLRLEDEDQQLALKILRIVMIAERPLDLLEVVEAVAVTPKIRSLEELRMKRLRRPSDVFEICGSLLRQSRSDGKIHLAHFSVKEFLSQPFLEKNRKNPFLVDEVEAIQRQLEACITYLSLSEFESETFRASLELATDEEHADSDLQIFAEAPLLDYAAGEWTSLVRRLSDEDVLPMWAQIRHFLSNKESSFRSWLLISQYSHGLHRFPNGTKPIHVAALFGIGWLVLQIQKDDPTCLGLKTVDGRTALHVAIQNEHEKMTSILLELKAPLDIADKGGRTPLHAAIESGNELLVTQLVSAGANVNTVQQSGETPISVAIENKWDVLADFLSTLADPKILLPDGRCLLHIAAQSGSLAWTVKLLSIYGSQLIEARDRIYWTPLHYASDNGHAAIVQALITAKCAIMVYDQKGWTPLHATIRRRHLECATMILDAKWNESQSERPAARITADVPGAAFPRYPAASASDGMPIRLTDPISQSRDRPTRRIRRRSRSRSRSHSRERRLASGKYSSRPSLSDNPLARQLGTSIGSSSIQRTGIPSRATMQESPLYLAVQENYTAGAKLLLGYPDQLGILKIDDLQKKRCLEAAIQTKNVEMCLSFMKNVPKTHLTSSILDLLTLDSDSILDECKKTFTVEEAYCDIILRTADEGEEELIPIILRNWPDLDGMNIAHVLRQSSVTTTKWLAKVFLENGVPVAQVSMENDRTPLMIATLKLSDITFAKVLLEHGASVDVSDHKGDTPLLILAGSAGQSNGSPVDPPRLEFAKLLIARGVNVDVSNKEGDTPLITLARTARQEGQSQANPPWLEFAKIIIAQGANVDSCNEQGDTPLIILARTTGHGEQSQANTPWLELAKLIIARGANVNFCNKQGDTPLLLLARHMYGCSGSIEQSSCLEFARLLLRQGANADACNKQGNTPLLILAGSVSHNIESQDKPPWLDFTELLVSRGANIHATDERCRGICHRAAMNGNTKLLKYAVDTLQLSIGVRDKFLRSPLFLAVEGGRDKTVVQITQYLTAQNGIIDAMDYADLRSSPLLRALVNRNERKASILTTLATADEHAFQRLSQERQAELQELRTSLYFEALCWAIDCEYPAGFTYLLSKVPRTVLFSHSSLDGDNVLHCACNRMTNDYLKTLIQSLLGNSNATYALHSFNIKGKSPLDIALSSRASEKVILLLRAGVTPNTTQLPLARILNSDEVQRLLSGE